MRRVHTQTVAVVEAKPENDVSGDSNDSNLTGRLCTLHERPKFIDVSSLISVRSDDA